MQPASRLLNRTSLTCTLLPGSDLTPSPLCCSQGVEESWQPARRSPHEGSESSHTELHVGSKPESEWVLLGPGMQHGVCTRPLTCSHPHYCSKPLTWF